MKLRMWFDGSCLPSNPGPITIGAFLIKNEEGTVVAKDSLLLRHENNKSSNFAEYHGLRMGLGALLGIQSEEIESCSVYGDSQLVIKQMLGEYSIRNNALYSDMAYEALVVMKNITIPISFNWIPREQNTEADAMTHYTCK